MMTATTKVLNSDQRRFLDAQTQRAREDAQRAAEDALRALAVAEPSRPGYLSDEQNKLRLALRDKARQLGDDTARAGAVLTNLVHDVAYEQWHRLLFARFLEVNGLLRHPNYRDIPLSLDDCGDLASDLGEPDAWAVAARFASEILPGVFRLTDPAVQVRFAAEHRSALERLLLDIPSEVFTTEDALGWVYQFWQTAEKKRVNESDVKIGGADLSPVTQLFTENYMVRFLLENSLGAWWAARHPASALLDGWEYFRRNEDGTPAAGSFSDWPERAADVTVMDPCCGSGHFLVAMFGMLWRMRAEEEGLTPAKAQDAVLRDNLHGLELDPRCTQIATFNVALEAWKQGGFRELPAPQIACSGVPVRAARADWEALAGDDEQLLTSLRALHSVFGQADTLGSLIDPRLSDHHHGLFGRDLSVGVSTDQVRSLLALALTGEGQKGTVLGYAAEDVVDAATLLGGRYTLVATNPPYLTRQKMAETLRDHLDLYFGRAGGDIAAAFIMRALALATPDGSAAMVLPLAWHAQPAYRELRKNILENNRWDLTAVLGSGAFRTISGEVVTTSLSVISARLPKQGDVITAVDVSAERSLDAKAAALRTEPVIRVAPAALLKLDGHRIVVSRVDPVATRLGSAADSRTGTRTSDNQRFRLHFWEVKFSERWRKLQVAPTTDGPYSGREYVVLWESGSGTLSELADAGLASIQGMDAWGKRGVCLGLTGSLRATLYTGEIFDMSCGVVWPKDEADLAALWAYCSSPEFAARARELDKQLKLTTKTLVQVPFDRDRWQRAAAEAGSLPSATSADPRQWLFDGQVASSAEPLQVGLARLLGYRWPDQAAGALDAHVDADGIVALQSLPGEADATTRLRALLADAYGGRWSAAKERQLVTAAGGKNARLEDWLRDSFFTQHVKLFDNRPFLWHIWDGRKDGFSAIVNYHRLDRRTLEKLTFTTLGAWIDRQKHEARAERPGADARLAAAEELQHRLQLILGGKPPYDVYIRWKEMAEQPIGWEPDLDDGVRLNIRPFVTAGVLRSKVNVHWRKDRGTNPDGSERHNDLHPTLEERRAARREAGDAE
ncbi:Eco57I restriction-modification methylase domain-containing protein [Corynebacterium variabile]|uniref:Eco57I restriction-modification methylase domain-containing protein n=2 Tax=Actinomycetes TaxID=1760 RepID=UPI003FD0DB0D